jgi:LysM repeat protein
MAAIASNPILMEIPKETMNAAYSKTIYYTHYGETLEDLSTIFKCEIAQLKAWNKLKSSKLDYCQPILVYHTNDMVIDQDRTGGPIVKELSNLDVPIQLGESNLSFRFSNEEAKIREEEFILYKIQKPQSLFEIAMKIEGVTFSDLLLWNGFERNLILRPGRVIKVKKTE